MIYPDVDLKSWCERYGLEIKRRACLHCGQVFETTVPVAVKGYRGLQAPLHECGEKYVGSIFVPVGRKEIKFWMDFKGG